jgi:GNAT superfamily N-acetyltransferase
MSASVANATLVVKSASFDADGEAIFELVNECYGVEIGYTGYAFKLTPRMMDPKQEQWLHGYAEGRVLKICGKDENGVDGVLFYELQPEKESIYFGPFAVRKSCNGKGYGRALIAAMEDIGRKSGMKWTSLFNINHREDLTSLYAHLGFETLEETVEYPVPERLTRPSHFIQLRRAL